MKITGVIVTCVTLTFCCLFFLSEVHHRLNGIHEQKELTRFWKRQTAVEQLKLAVINSRFSDFKQDVALLIPDASLQQHIDKEQKQQIRNLASVIPHHKLTLEIGASAKDLFDSGKKMVVENKYDEGLTKLQTLLKRFPDSHYTVEAHYLIVESYYNLKKFEDAVESVHSMVEIFPESRLTGYALLKVGNLYERENRLEDALQIYRTILSAYQWDPNLMALADKNVKLLEL